MITTAKGITAGYLPLGAVIVSEQIARFFEEHTFWGGLTYSGHPMSCAAGIATLQVYEKDGLLENTRRMEGIMAEGLADLQARHPTVGDVRGIGLFWVIELVQDRETREPLVPWNARASELDPMPYVAHYLHRQGVYTFVKWNWIFAVPPLCIHANQIAEGLAAIDGALKIADTSLEKG
jgi:taurine--2-oxoglutarate transaminase